MDTLDICNKIRLQAEGLSDNGVPIDVLPKKVQQIILDFATQENYMVEYSFASLLSAAATAIGNSYHIRVKSNWVTNAALYMILVGRAGLGKTPPLEAMYKPIRELDKKRFLTYKTEMEVLNMNKEDINATMRIAAVIIILPKTILETILCLKVSAIPLPLAPCLKRWHPKNSERPDSTSPTSCSWKIRNK